MEIKKENYAYTFTQDDISLTYPVDSVIFITNGSSDIVNVRVKSSRRNVIQFNWKDVKGINAEDVNDFVQQIINM